jgi:diguanylate cyclase (GGDEF)-like protein
MNPLQSLPDLAAMVILMGVLEWLRRKHRDSSVNLWMLALTFILVEALALALLKASPSWSRLAHALALDSYLLAAVTFGWASHEDLLPGTLRVPLFFPPALPLLVIATMYGFSAGTGRTYVCITGLTLIVGIVYLLTLVRARWRFRSALAAVHLVLWIPMVWMAAFGHLRGMVYWGLGCLYLMVAFSFRNRVRRGDIGGIVIISGFIVWAACFFAHPTARDLPFWNQLVSDVWTMQKFFVIIGMMLVLLEDQTRRLADEALHDPLTGLPNRRLFDDRLQQAIERTRRTGRSTAVFIIDLDSFKQINDTHGHRTGDIVLTRAANMLKARLRSVDTLARCGGDEFSVIVNDIPRPGDCETIVETLRSAISSVDLPGGSVAPLRASVGYALFPDDVAEAEELCELADIRMYKDKRMGALLRVGRR